LTITIKPPPTLSLSLFLLLPPPSSPLFPYTTLFRSLFSQARQSLAQPAGCQGQAKSLVQNGRGFAQGHPQFFVQDGRQRQGFRTHLRGGRSQGVGGLAGITTLDSFATFRAVADLDMKTGHPCLAHDLGLILVLHVPAL